VSAAGFRTTLFCRDNRRIHTASSREIGVQCCVAYRGAHAPRSPKTARSPKNARDHDSDRRNRFCDSRRSHLPKTARSPNALDGINTNAARNSCGVGSRDRSSMSASRLEYRVHAMLTATACRRCQPPVNSANDDAINNELNATASRRCQPPGFGRCCSVGRVPGGSRPPLAAHNSARRSCPPAPFGGASQAFCKRLRTVPSRRVRPH
jgi:hypothetical protein